MNSLLNELNILAFKVAPVFYKVLLMSLAAIIIGAIIILIRRIADKKISPVWKYILWGVMIVALLFPYRPQSKFALIKNTKQIEDLSFRRQYDDIKYELKILEQTENPTREEQSSINNLRKQEDVTYLKSTIFDLALPLLWLFTMVTLFVFLIASKIILSYKINKHKIKSEQHHNLLLECKKTMGIKSDIRIIVQNYIDSPALMGIFKPKILLPKYIEDMSQENISYIILHELAHFKRRDMIVNYLLLALQAVYWFNPVVWLLFRFIREDMELLNDAYVINHIGFEKSTHYARSLVEVLGHTHNISLVPKLICMVDGKKNVERRIKMIKLGETFKQHKIIISIACIMVVCVVSILLLTSGGKLSYYRDINPKVIEITTDEGMIAKELNKEQSEYLEDLLEYDTWKRAYINELNGLKIATMNVISYGDGKMIWIYENTDEKYLYFSVGSEKGEIYKASKHIWDNIYEFAIKLSDSKEQPEKNLKRSLTQVEIEEVNKAFEQLIPSENPEYEYSINPISHFFTSYYEKPEHLNLQEFIWYFHSGEVLRSDSPDDVKQFNKLVERDDFPFNINTLEEMPVPIQRKTLSSVNEVLNRYAGINVSNLINTEGVLYLEPYDAFYTTTSDFGAGYFTCNGGEIDGETVRLFSEQSTLTLEYKDGRYLIVSHLESK